MARTNKNKNICRAQNMHVYPVRCVVLNSSVCTVIHYGQGSVPHQHFVQYVYGYPGTVLYGCTEEGGSRTEDPVAWSVGAQKEKKKEFAIFKKRQG